MEEEILTIKREIEDIYDINKKSFTFTTKQCAFTMDSETKDGHALPDDSCLYKVSSSILNTRWENSMKMWKSLGVFLQHPWLGTKEVELKSQALPKHTKDEQRDDKVCLNSKQCSQ